MPRRALALLEVGNLSPTIVAADRCAKSAQVHLLGIEKTHGAAQCIKVVGPVGAVTEAVEAGAKLALEMGSTAEFQVIPAPLETTHSLAMAPPEYLALLSVDDALIPREDSMNNGEALGLLETQGLVAALHATDEMLKSAAVSLVGKEKIGAAYVTIMIRGDVAAVQSAIETGKTIVARLGGKLIMADVIARPHPELTALLPKAVES